MSGVDLLALAERIKRREEGFAEAVAALPMVMAGLDKGYQFNSYDSASNDDDTPDEDCLMNVCIGPITDARLICRVEGRAMGELIADALTLAAALRARHQSAAGEGENNA